MSGIFLAKAPFARYLFHTRLFNCFTVVCWLWWLVISIFIWMAELIKVHGFKETRRMMPSLLTQTTLFVNHYRTQPDHLLLGIGLLVYVFHYGPELIVVSFIYSSRRRRYIPTSKLLIVRRDGNNSSPRTPVSFSDRWARCNYGFSRLVLERLKPTVIRYGRQLSCNDRWVYRLWI